MVTDYILIVSQLHYSDLVLLAFLFIVVNFSIPVFKQFSAFSDFVLKPWPFVLETYRHLSDFSINHRFPLTLHHISKIFELFGLTFFSGLIPRFPFLNFLTEFWVLAFFCFVFLFEREIHIIEFVFEHFVFMVESLADLVQFFILLPVFINLFLLCKTLFRQLPDLYFIVLSIEQLSFVLFDSYSQNFDLLRQPLDFDGLENYNKLYVVTKIGLSIIG